MTALEFLAQWLIRSSIFVASGSLLLWLLRMKNSSIRGLAWTALLFGSLSLPVLTLAFPKTPAPALRRAAAGVVIRAVESPAVMVSRPQPAVAGTPAPATRVIEENRRPVTVEPRGGYPRARQIGWRRVTLIVYSAICAGMLLRLCVGLLFGWRLIRRSRPADLVSPVEIRESGDISAPLTIGILRPAIVLPLDWQAWKSAKLEGVLAHERSHIERRDPWVQLLSGIHRAMLWANPLSWFLHRRILETAEEVSDDAALAAVKDRVSYAETLLEFMQRGVWKSGFAGVSMARHGNPEKRIRRILNSTGFSGGITRRSVAAIAAVVSPFAYVIATAQTHPQFDVADVHVSAPNTSAVMRGGAIRAGVYQIQNATMVDLIKTAYGLDSDKVVGGPSWMELDRYDIYATAPALTSADEAKLMLQALLADRFKLALHKDTRPMSGFALTIGRSGPPRLKKAGGSGGPGCASEVQYKNDAELAARRQTLTQAGKNPLILQAYLVMCRNMTMAAFAESMRTMPNPVTGGVADRTGLSGGWDFNFKYTARPPLSAAGAETDENITIFDALEKQLGLKLEAAKVPAPVVVVDGVNRQPSDNSPNAQTILSPPPPAAFEVADLKLSPPNAPGVRSPGPQPGGRFEVRNFPLTFLITMAWQLPSNGALTGKPAWLDAVRVDLIAKLPSTDVSRGVTGVTEVDAFVPALKALLTERFKVAIHTEQRPASGYALVAAKPKMRTADASLRTKCFEGPGADGKDPRRSNPLLSRLVTCQNITMPEFAKQLKSLSGGYIGNEPVVDASGIEGAYDFTLSFSGARSSAAQSAMGLTAGQPTAADPDGLTLFDALEKQLGVKLAKRNIPAPVVVLDHIEETPSAN